MVSFPKPDLNCDLGEIDPTLSLEAEIMPLIHRCNIACGGHAGGDEMIKGCILLAKENKVLIGAHPSYPDKVNFGRVSMNIDPKELKETLTEQINKVLISCTQNSYPMTYVKAHGALYHDVAYRAELALIFASLIKDLGDFEVMGPPDSSLELICKNLNLVYLREAFADRKYTSQGRLLPRKVPGAVLVNLKEIIAQCDALINKNLLQVMAGKSINLDCDSICVHSDTDHSLQILKEIKKTFF